MSRWVILTVAAVVIGLVPAQLCADAPPPNSWPMFRGSRALLGVANVRFPVTTFGPLWNFKTQGPVKSSPAIEGRRGFFCSGDGNLYALDLNNRKKMWAFKNQAPIESVPLVL